MTDERLARRIRNEANDLVRIDIGAQLPLEPLSVRLWIACQWKVHVLASSLDAARLDIQPCTRLVAIYVICLATSNGDSFG